jgi:hypothetical protein
MVNSEIYNNDTRHANFHQLSADLNKYQKWVYCLSVKVFNMLPPYIKIESDKPKKFKLILQKFLCENFVILWMNILNLKKISIWKSGIYRSCRVYNVIPWTC